MSKMKFCFYFYEKSKHPKFYDEACRILAKGMRSAFTSQNEVDIFVHMVKEALQEYQPDGHSSRVSHNFSADGGQICIESGNIDDDIARLYYHTIDKYLEYDLEAQDFFNVSERYETKGGGGMMITFGESWAYGVQGRKVDELLEYIKKNIEYTHLKEDEPETVVTNLLEDKVAELNEKYPKTVKYFVKRVFGSIRIGNLGGATKGISIRVIISRPFEKGGEV